MKKTLSLLLSLALLVVCTLPAGAYSLCDDGYSIYPNTETRQFWETYRSSLKAQEIYDLAADNSNFCGEFHDGLLLVHEAVTVPAEKYPGLNDNYVNQNGELVDLNRNRYDLMYSFSNGYAAAAQFHAYTDEGKRGGVAFVDTSGREAVPFNEEWSVFRVDNIDYAGRFENGRALVVREVPGEGPLSGRVYSTSVYTAGWDKWRGIEYAYIDTAGNLLTDWTRTDDPNQVMKLPLYDRNNVWIGYRLDPAAWAAAAKSSAEIFSSADSESEGTPVVPVQPAEYQSPALPGYAQADTSFQSHGKITSYALGDMDMGNLVLTVTNNTDGWDSGVIAVVAANVDGSTGTNCAGVFFVPYLVGPHASENFSVGILDIIHQYMFGSDFHMGATLSADALTGKVDAKVIHFEDDADLREFYETVPYEQDWSAQGVPNEFRPVCNGGPGKEFLQMLGINRSDNDENVNHSFCRRW